MYPIFKTFYGLKYYVSLYPDEKKKWLHYQKQKKEKKKLKNHNMSIQNGIRKTILSNSFLNTNRDKSIFSIIENGYVNDSILDDFFNDFNLEYLNSANSNINQEFTLRNETPIFKSHTTVLVNNQEYQVQIIENQTLHNTNQFILQHTMMNQPEGQKNQGEDIYYNVT